MTGAIAFLILGIALIIFGTKNDIGMIAACGGFMICIGFYGLNVSTHKEPTAMDVYQGKTTLEITYKDGVAIDSVVVFKNKEEQQ